MAGRLLLAAASVPVAVHFWAVPEARGSVLLIAAMLWWSLDLVPDYVVALGVIVVWNVAAIGPSAPSLSGFASPAWFLLVGVFAIGGGLAAVGLGLAAFTGSGLLSRVFMSGATLNLLAWGLLPPDAQPGWWKWTIASTPTLLVLSVGALGTRPRRACSRASISARPSTGPSSSSWA